jgi:plastocyanin
MKKSSIAIAIFVLAAGCHWNSSQPDAPMNPANQATIITIGNTTLSPTNVTVRAGSPVYWRNSDHSTHRIVLDDRRYDSSDIAPGSLGCGLILSDAGTHAYHDLNNPALTGTITVTQ